MESCDSEKQKDGEAFYGGAYKQPIPNTIYAPPDKVATPYLHRQGGRLSGRQSEYKGTGEQNIIRVL